MNNIHEKIMGLAIEQAELAFKFGEVPVGAVITNKNWEVISKAYNQVESNKDCTQHAEILAIKEASKNLKNWRLQDCSIFITLEPCTMCMGAILQSRISSIYFGAYEPKTGAAGSIYDLSNNPNLPYKVKVFPEVLESQCSMLLKNFFQKIR